MLATVRSCGAFSRCLRVLHAGPYTLYGPSLPYSRGLLLVCPTRSCMQHRRVGQDPTPRSVTEETRRPPTLRPTVASCLSVACLLVLDCLSSLLHSETRLGQPRGGGCPRRLDSGWLHLHLQTRLERHYWQRWLTADFETHAGTFAVFRPAPQVISRNSREWLVSQQVGLPRP
jgi:hypothetical protein